MSAESKARLQAAVDQFGAAMTESLIEGLTESLVNLLAKRGETGPWTLHADGRIERWP